MGNEPVSCGGGNRRRRIWVAVVVFGSLSALLVGLQSSAVPPWLIAVDALVPAAAFATITLVLGRGRVAWLPWAATFLWGATVAPLGAQVVNDAALRLFPQALVTAVVGPLAEEIAKASAVLIVMLAWPSAVCGVRDGIVYGALAGLGFTATENLGYFTIAAIQGGPAGLTRALYVRGVLEGWNHAAFTAIIGAALGSAQRRRSRRSRLTIFGAGFAIALVVHGGWNALASTAITTVLCNAPAEGAACAAEPRLIDLLVTVPLLVVVFIGPLAAVLLMLAFRDPSRPPGNDD